MAIHYFTASIEAALKTAHRVCPACGRKQHVSAEKKDEVVVCDRCGADVPPNPKVTDPQEVPKWISE